MPARKIDPERLAQMAAKRLSAAVICQAFGVSRQAVSMACQRYEINVPDGRMKPRVDPVPTQVRCLDCGGLRANGVAHHCRPAHPVTRGTLWARVEPPVHAGPARRGSR